MKRISSVMSIFLAVLLVFTLLTGCKDKAETTETSKTTKQTEKETEKVTEQTTEPETEATLKEAVVQWYTAYPEVDSGRDQVYEAFNKILKEKINASVNFNIIEFGQWGDKIGVLLASGEDIDIVWHNWSFSYAANVSKGLYKPLDDLLENYGQSILRDIPSAMMDIQRIGGEIYAIPCYQISTQGSSQIILKDVVDKTGYDITKIKTIPEFEPFLKEAHEAFPDLYDVMAKGGGIWGSYMMMLGWEGFSGARGNCLAVDYYDDTKTVFNMYATPEYKEYCEMINRWYNEGYIRKDVASVSDTTPEERAGKYVVTFGGTILYPGYNTIEAKNINGFDYVEVITSKSFWTHTSGQSTMLCIASQSKEPERAMMVLDLLNDDQELTDTLAYGIEGVNYTRLSPTKVERIPNTGYNFNWQWSMLNTFKMSTESTVADDHNAKVLKTMADAVPSQLAGFTENADEYDIYFAQCKTAWEEKGIGLSTGVLDPAVNLPQFLEQLKAAGIDEMIEIIQGQIDEQLK